MKITFAPDAAQDWDGMNRVFTSGLVGATVDITYREGWAPIPDGYDRPVTDYHPSSCDIVEVLESGLTLAYDDGSFTVDVPFADIEEVTYL